MKGKIQPIGDNHIKIQDDHFTKECWKKDVKLIGNQVQVFSIRGINTILNY